MSFPTYDEAYAKARDRRPFSNGTEGYGWLDANCGSCVHDKAARYGDEGNGCPLILVSILGRTPAEWLDGPRDEQGRYSIEGQYTCVYRRDENDPGPDEPTPVPDIPGQEELFPRDEFERPARMFSDTRPSEVTSCR